MDADMVIPPALTRRQLREFGLVTGGMFAGLFGLLLPWLGGLRYPAWPWWIAAVLAAWALVSPDTLRPLHRLWMRVGHAMGRVTTPVILGAVFFLVITPMACVMRLAGRDPMARKFDENAESYRVASTKLPKETMERPF